jgi:hypothetical protein
MAAVASVTDFAMACSRLPRGLNFAGSWLFEGLEELPAVPAKIYLRILDLNVLTRQDASRSP